MTRKHKYVLSLVVAMWSWSVITSVSVRHDIPTLFCSINVTVMHCCDRLLQSFHSNYLTYLSKLRVVAGGENDVRSPKTLRENDSQPIMLHFHCCVIEKAASLKSHVFHPVLFLCCTKQAEFYFCKYRNDWTQVWSVSYFFDPWNVRFLFCLFVLLFFQPSVTACHRRKFFLILAFLWIS